MSHYTYWLAALYLPQIGPRTFLKWLAQFSNNIENLFQASRAALRAAGIPPACIEIFLTPPRQRIAKDLRWLESPHHHLLTLQEADYPQLLKEISDPPLVLFVQGNRHALALPQMAIVGSRSATPAGLKNAEQFAYYLAQAGFAITSGLALGIDGAAHRGALLAQQVTIGVAATGLYHSYPPAHQTLMATIVANQGAIISEFPLDATPKPWHFPRRNRIISGLSVGTLLVEAALKSGSLITAHHALSQGREVFAIPGSIHQPQSKGCHSLIRQGAKLVETAQDILEELSAFQALYPVVSPKAQGEPIQKREVTKRALTPLQTLLLQQIDYQLTPMDVILCRSALTAGEVSSMLLSLELSGYIQVVTGGYVRIE